MVPSPGHTACHDREDLLALGLTDRRYGYPLEMVVRAIDAGWRVAERDVDYPPRTGRSKVTGTLRGTARTVQDMRRSLESGPVEAAELALAALLDTLATVLATPARRRILVLTGKPGAWVPDGIEVRAQCDGGLDERIADALAGADGPTLLVGMDTL